MKKGIIRSLSIAALVLGVSLVTHTASAADSMASTSKNKVEIDVMTHLCDPSIKNEADFKALTNGKDVLGGFANQVLHCPTTVLPANAPVAGTVASPQTHYDFTVMGEHNPTQMLKNSDFFSEKLCESDINEDVNADGMISTSTCLDTSEYHFNNLSADNGKVDVTESMPPQGYHFGTLLFTPTVVDQNNDQQSLLGIDKAQGRIQLDTTNDTDKMITLHVYDFVNSDNPQGLVNGMPIGGSMNMGSSTASSTMSTTTTNMSVVNQIQALEQQIQSLFTQIQSLLAQLK